MQQDKYSIKTCEGKNQSTYDEAFYVAEGRKELVAKTSEYINSDKKIAETEKIIEEHQTPAQT
jgi:hypothetical protein